MNRTRWQPILALVAWLAAAAAAMAQQRPYIGFVYPAGGQQGTTFQVRLGGQGLDGVHAAFVSGPGVKARVVEYQPRLNPMELTLLREQRRELNRGLEAEAPAVAELRRRIDARVAEFVRRPACASIANLVLLEIQVASDAEPGQRELTVATRRGLSNPLVFHVGQLPEVSRKPMSTAEFQVLGKEEAALRKRPDDEIEQRITLPCTVNGQIASGEINQYRFEARKGQRVVVSAVARQLVPYIADAVPGWFQPVMTLCDASGKELAYGDDYRFQPDPTIYLVVPKDGQYLLRINDALYRGREDFVYRVSIGELPFVTGVFPLGSRAGATRTVQLKGWNLDNAVLTPPGPDAPPGRYLLAASDPKGHISNRVPFVVDTLPESFEKEPNDDPAHSQNVKLPILVNGRIQRRDDWDVFQVEGRAGQSIVAEVTARRLDSPLDSFLKLTDTAGKVIAMNDDHDGAGYGVNTHQADSYLMATLPADGTYYIHLGDTARSGGEDYAYRLRISSPRPDFALYTVPSTGAMRSKGSSVFTVYAVRKDGFNGPIKLGLTNPPAEFSASPSSLPSGQSLARVAVKTARIDTARPVNLTIDGRAKIGGKDVVRTAVPAEDRMQAFLWRHLVPEEELHVLVFNPANEPASKRVPPARTASVAEKQSMEAASSTATAPRPKFTKQQVAGRLRQLKLLYEEGLLTDDFYLRKAAECEAVP